MSSDPGCPVTDDRPCPGGLALDEHFLEEGRWLHPVLDAETGWYVRPDEGATYCTRTDNACSGRSCWICRGDTFTKEIA